MHTDIKGSVVLGNRAFVVFQSFIIIIVNFISQIVESLTFPSEYT